MNRNQAEEILPIIQALADGRTIQFAATDKEWVDLDSDDGGVFLETLINNPQSYRIKPGPKYRPFKDAEECWEEMLKHQPFGWVKSIDNKDSEVFIHCTAITKEDGILTGIDEIPFPYYGMFNNYTFADGTSFGMKEEDQLWKLMKK